MFSKLAQGIKTQHSRLKRGFTLIELVAVIGILCLLASFVLPALARAKIKSPNAGCLSNLRQMQLGATMYRDDHNDALMPNSPDGGGDGIGANGVAAGWVQKTENWSTADANTNVADYANALLWPYVNRDISVYRCPADFKPSDNGYRLRSYSMNGQMGIGLTAPDITISNYNPGWRIYYKGSDLTCPTPANAFIFCDESMYSLNDGYLQLDLNAPDYPDVPAAYHAAGCGFSFADGHAEIQRWVYNPGPQYGILNCPYQYNVVNNGMHWPGSVHDPDWLWLTQHAACHK